MEINEITSQGDETRILLFEENGQDNDDDNEENDDDTRLNFLVF